LGVIYTKLFDMLKARGRSSTYWLRQQGISPTIVNKLRKNERIDTDTISRLCKLLDCQPGDIMEYVPDEEERDKT
jgi:putative transcriptional regulator